MSLSATLQTAFSGLGTAQRSLNVTAHNVANTNTPGYTRKVLEQESLVLGGRGAGAEAGDLARLTDTFLLGEVRRQAATAAESEVVTRFHDRVQDFLGAPGDDRDLAAQIGQLASAIDGLANSPEASAQALEVVNLAEGLGLSLDSLAGRVQRLRDDADREIGDTVGAINGELEAIADLNREISRLARQDQDHVELLDRRDALLESLSEKIDISTYAGDDGSIVVQTGGGQALVDGEARVLVHERAAHVGTGTVLGRISVFRQDQIDPESGTPFAPDQGIVLVSEGVRADVVPGLDPDQQIESQIRGGRLAGLLEVRDRVLPRLDDQLQELASGLRFALNAAHNRGVAQPPPASLSGTRTDLADFAGATRAGSATLAVIDRNGGGTLAAFEIDVGAAADETDVVAAINAGLGGLGTAGIGADGNLEIDLADATHGLAIAEGDSSIATTDAAGRTPERGFSHYFGLNDLLVTRRELPSTLGVRADIRATPSRLGTARLDVEAGPPLVASLGGAGDNRGALELADALRSQHDVIARGTLPAKSTSMIDYAGDIIAHVAIEAERAGETAGRDRSLAEALDFRAAAVSGVNIDEEMSRMIVFQQAYTASARVIQTAERMFDELFRIVG